MAAASYIFAQTSSIQTLSHFSFFSFFPALPNHKSLFSFGAANNKKPATNPLEYITVQCCFQKRKCLIKKKKRIPTPAENTKSFQKYVTSHLCFFARVQAEKSPKITETRQGQQCGTHTRMCTERSERCGVLESAALPKSPFPCVYFSAVERSVVQEDVGDRETARGATRISANVNPLNVEEFFLV